MLRTILHKRRKRVEVESASVSASSDTTNAQEEDCLESWMDLIKTAAVEAVVGIKSWESQRRARKF